MVRLMRTQLFILMQSLMAKSLYSRWSMMVALSTVATGAKSDILIDVPTESQRTKPSKKMNGAQWSHEDGGDDDEYDNDMQDQSS